MNTDDPKLTAYALGELDDAERAALESQLAADPEALAYVAATREFAARLEAELKDAPQPDLTDAQKREISLETRPKIASFPRRLARWSLLAAAVIAIGLVIAGLLFPSISAVRSSPENALLRRETPPPVEEAETTPALALNVPRDTAPLPDAKPASEEPSLFGLEIAEAPPVPRPNATPPAAPSAEAPWAGGYAGSRSLAQQPGNLVAGLAGEGHDKQDASSIAPRARRAAPVSSSVAGLSPGTVLAGAEVGGMPARGNLFSDQPSGLSLEGFNTEAYDHLTDNPFLRVAQNPLSTFSIDVDTASYANVRRFLKSNALPPKGAVRIEELINYFTYQYPEPQGDDPFSVNVEMAPAPWNDAHQLVRIGLKGRDIPAAERPPCNLVFLLDVSGSMNEPNKLPLVQQSMKMLTGRLRPDDRIAIVVYAGSTGLVLPSTELRKKADVLDAIDNLRAGGSTNGAAGIQLAYDIARANFIKDGANRVILCTDGDFNVGVTNQGELVRLIEKKAKSGVFLTVLGFGMGNYKDSTLEKLADKGNGAYGYVDTGREAQKLFVDQLSGTLVTIAKDVKIQVELNPEHVGAFRLIGYENRLLRAEDFNDDKKDAGEIGAGHTVTALYELIPAGHEDDIPNVDALKYRKPTPSTTPSGNPEWMTVKLRYKAPDGDTSNLIEQPVTPSGEPGAMSKDLQFAAAVAEFGMLLRESPHKGTSTFATALDLAENGMGPDREGYRREFIDLLRLAKGLTE